MTAAAFSISQLAKRWHTRRERVRALIESGILEGFDLTPTGPRRTYRIGAQAVTEFEADRTVRPKQKRRRVADSCVKEFF